VKNNWTLPVVVELILLTVHVELVFNVSARTPDMSIPVPVAVPVADG
jgi:hypothetical protein